MCYKPLTYRPTTRRERFEDWLKRRWSNITQLIAGLSPYDDRGWQTKQTLMRRSKLARRIYFLSATGNTNDRTVEGLTRHMAAFYQMIDDQQSTAEPTEQAVAAALDELRENGLIDQAGRPRALVDIVK
jgi:hypothetical protein